MRKRLALVLLVLLSSACLAQTTAGAHQPSRAENCQYDWPKEEVDWIIPDDERAAYYKLASDEERTQFINTFWLRRDPSPDTIINELRNEHYRRIHYANEHFSTKDVIGWRTDPGRVYIKYGPPDSAACAAENDIPALIWKYRWMDDYTGYWPYQSKSLPIEFRFLDTCRCGNYMLQIGEDDKRHLFDQSKPLPDVVETMHGSMRLWPRKPPVVRLVDLEQLATNHVSRSELPLQFEMKTAAVTNRTDFLSLELTFHGYELAWREPTLGTYAQVEAYGRLTKTDGRVALVFEDGKGFGRPAIPVVPPAEVTLTIPIYIYRGDYQLDLVVRDVYSGKIATLSRHVTMPMSDWCK